MTTDPVEILNERNAEVAKIRGYADLTEEAKQRRIAEVNEQARAAYAEAIETRKREIARRVEKAESALFKIPIPYSSTDAEEAQIRAAHRAAYDSVYYAVTPALDSGDMEGLEHGQEELERLRVRAERTGDNELARAVYHLATERGIRDVANRYLESRPQERQRWEEYVAAKREEQDASGIGNRIERSIADRAFEYSEYSDVG